MPVQQEKPFCILPTVQATKRNNHCEWSVCQSYYSWESQKSDSVDWLQRMGSWVPARSSSPVNHEHIWNWVCVAVQSHIDSTVTSYLEQYRIHHPKICLLAKSVFTQTLPHSANDNESDPKRVQSYPQVCPSCLYPKGQMMPMLWHEPWLAFEGRLSVRGLCLLWQQMEQGKRLLCLCYLHPVHCEVLSCFLYFKTGVGYVYCGNKWSRKEVTRLC